MEVLRGGADTPCTMTMDGLLTFSLGALAVGGPMGLALGLTIGATTLALHAMGACGSAS